MSWFYYVLQFATALILFLAANTSFAGFPRLVSILAEDRYMPRQLTNLGDRLVYNNGIIILALVACAVIIVFEASVTAMIALYAVGVFVAFTLSQCGMVVHWWHTRGKRWKSAAAVNASARLQLWWSALLSPARNLPVAPGWSSLPFR